MHKLNSSADPTVSLSGFTRRVGFAEGLGLCIHRVTRAIYCGQRCPDFGGEILALPLPLGSVRSSLMSLFISVRTTNTREQNPTIFLFSILCVLMF